MFIDLNKFVERKLNDSSVKFDTARRIDFDLFCDKISKLMREEFSGCDGVECDVDEEKNVTIRLRCEVPEFQCGDSSELYDIVEMCSDFYAVNQDDSVILNFRF